MFYFIVFGVTVLFVAWRYISKAETTISEVDTLRIIIREQQTRIDELKSELDELKRNPYPSPQERVTLQ